MRLSALVEHCQQLGLVGFGCLKLPPDFRQFFAGCCGIGSRLVTLAARSYYDDLLAAGVKIHEYGPRMLHTKALLIDETTALLGSANFDHRSFRLNFEIALLFQDRGVTGALASLVEGELEAAPQVRDDRARPLFGTRLPEALARLMSPLL